MVTQFSGLSKAISVFENMKLSLRNHSLTSLFGFLLTSPKLFAIGDYLLSHPPWDSTRRKKKLKTRGCLVPFRNINSAKPKETLRPWRNAKLFAFYSTDHRRLHIDYLSGCFVCSRTNTLKKKDPQKPLAQLGKEDEEKILIMFEKLADTNQIKVTVFFPEMFSSCSSLPVADFRRRSLFADRWNRF